MRIETLLFGFAPALVAIVATGISLVIAWKRRGIIQYLLSLIVLLATTFSFLLLYSIFVRGAWPTFIPHVAIVASLGVIFVQLLLSGSRKHD
jgi:hypothetical protein